MQQSLLVPFITLITIFLQNQVSNNRKDILVQQKLNKSKFPSEKNVYFFQVKNVTGKKYENKRIISISPHVSFTLKSITLSFYSQKNYIRLLFSVFGCFGLTKAKQPDRIIKYPKNKKTNQSPSQIERIVFKIRFNSHFFTLTGSD